MFSIIAAIPWIPPFEHKNQEGSGNVSWALEREVVNCIARRNYFFVL